MKTSSGTSLPETSLGVTNMTTNQKPVERIYIDDKRVKPQTIAHHVARYQFAIDSMKPGGNAIDLGCGTGYGTDMLREAGYDYVCGIDSNREAIEYAQKTFPESRYLYCDLNYLGEILSFGAKYYDLITFFEVIEHLTFKEGKILLRTIRDVLHSDGLFIMSTPRDINGKYNNFHKSEWSFDTLKNELGSLFDIHMYGQDWDTGEITDKNVRENDFYIVVCKLKKDEKI